MTSIEINPISTYSTGIFDQSAAEINAFDASTNRLFVVNANNVTVEVLDLSNPNNPIKIGEINATTFGGVANSVAVKNGIVAIAIEAVQKTDAGKVVFFASNGDFTTALNSVPVGALPDMLTFTVDGKKVLVANEGESDGNIDPNGSISIIDLSNGVQNATVATAGFTKFNGSENNLRNAGVRIFPNKNVAQDVEPEYISISADQTTAYVSLQENNAIAIVDIATATVKAIMPLGFGDRSRGLPALETFDFNNLANLSNGNGDLISATGETVKLGGFSGLWYEGVAENGNLKFLTIPDRGPNRDASGNDTVFVLPNYQARVVSFELNETTKEIIITNEILLKRPNGKPLTGLPNIPNFDQRGVDANGNPITNTLQGLQHLTINANGSVYDSLGADLEGIVKAANGDLWAVDEYRPSIYHFDQNGTLINRFVPENTAALANLLNPTANFKLGDFGQETLPAEYFSRRGNRGFEGMALDTDNGILYAFIQTPLSNPNRSASNNSSVIRMLGINPSNGETVAEYIYLLQKPAIGEEVVDKIGDAVYAGNGQFYIIERDSSLEATAQKFVYKFDLTGATNLRSPNTPKLLPNKTLEQHTADELAALGIGVIDKVKVTNLPSLGYLPSDKAEGLTILPDGRLAVLNDNDFGIVEGIEKIQLGLIDFNQSNGLDTSDRDNSINITNHPIFAMFMPDAIATYQVEGKTYIVTANEGDSRGEEIRVGNNNVILDAVKFPNALELKENTNLGRLNISSIDGDIDGDGDYDRLQTYGNRSFSIWDENFNLVFDSGDQFETFIATQIAADGLPFNAFNTNHTNNDSFDTRSDDKGIEPEGITIGVIDGQTYAFIGLERASGIMVYNISNPNQPEFVKYLNNRNYLDQNGLVIPTNTNGVTNPATGDLGPEGLTFINAEDSPNGKPLLVVSNEVSGTTTIYQIDLILPPVVIGNTNVFLQGNSPTVLLEETNLGNLIVDAHFKNTKTLDNTVDIALINSGAIRSSVEIGEITNIDVENISPFNNNLVLLTLSGTELEQIIEQSVANYGSIEIGSFPQISGLTFSFDPDNVAIAFNENGTVITDGKRVQSALIKDSEGNQIKLVENGNLVAENANKEFRLVTLEFLANGGDGYPLNIFGENIVNLNLTEQNSLTNYLQTNYLETPFNITETPITKDNRIQNLNFRDDTILEGITPSVPKIVNGTKGNDLFDSAFPDAKNFIGSEQILFTGSGNDVVDVSQEGENNRIDTGSDNDMVFSGSFNRIILGEGNDKYFFSGGKGGDRLTGGEGSDQFWLLTDQNLLPQTINQIGDFNNKFDVIGFANTDFNLGNKGTLWNYQQNGNNVIISAFNQLIAQLLNTTIYDNNFVFG